MDDTGDTSLAERHAEKASRRLVGLMSAATASHVSPYLLWLFPIAVFQFSYVLGFAVPREWAAPVYAAKSLLCALLIVWLKPWRYSERKSSGLALGVAPGVLVAALWILPETPAVFKWAPGFADFYNRWLIMPPGDWPSYFQPDIFPALPAAHPSLAYSPLECGWTLTIAKLLGSAFVISAAEEWFFRGFLYRWLRKGDFLSIDPARYDAQSFWLVVLVFGLEHDRWLAGMMAGAVYGWVVLRTGRIGPAIVAHATTNLALGIYIILSRQYGFW